MDLTQTYSKVILPGRVGSENPYQSIHQKEAEAINASAFSIEVKERARKGFKNITYSCGHKTLCRCPGEVPHFNVNSLCHDCLDNENRAIRDS